MKKRNKKYNPKKGLAYQRLMATDLLPFFGEFNQFFNNLLHNKFKYISNEVNDVLLQKIYVITYIYNEVDGSQIERTNNIRDILNNVFNIFLTTTRREYIFTEEEYRQLANIVCDCHNKAIFMIRKKWAYSVARAGEYIEMSFKIKLPPIGHFLNVEEMNQALLKLFLKDGYINANYLS